MDFVVIPCIDGFPKFSLASSKVGTIIMIEKLLTRQTLYKISAGMPRKQMIMLNYEAGHVVVL